MKSDLDAFLQARGLDALLVVGPGDHNPAMVYLTCGAHLTRADIVKKRGMEPVLFYRSMERDEAAKTGLPTRNVDEYRIDLLLKEHNGDMVKTMAAVYCAMLSDLGLSEGRVALSGRLDAGETFAVFSAVQERLPGLSFTGGVRDSVIMEAMTTKDAAEVERIRRMGQITTGVIGRVAEFLTAQKAKDGLLVKADGSPVTVGDVKSRINLWLAESGAENPEGTIFAIGRDAGVPHSAGAAGDVLRLGQTIVFDIFPCEAGGGYFFDITRTWCLGYATDEAWALYEDVRSAYDTVLARMAPGTFTRDYQHLVCDLFEARGHPTLRSNPLTQEGYVHGLGHGVGLNIHERPWMSATSDDTNRLDPGVVLTVEPGLYYPERGMGVRLENTVWVRPDGQMEVLADYPMDLVLPIR